MNIPYYQVDVFTNQLFRGNPAGVCLLPAGWLADDLMQSIAFENNLSETAFVMQQGDRFGLRWFTPALEMDLCGHATVAPAHVLMDEIGLDAQSITFETRSGPVTVTKQQDTLVLDFPSRPPQLCEPPESAGQLEAALGKTPVEVRRSRDYFFVYEHEKDIRTLNPDFELLRAWDSLGIIVTAAGDSVDFVSRFFAPAAGVNEDPVTGSAHASLIPYWAERLGKSQLHALQLSARGGELFCEHAEPRVKIGGRALTYFHGEITLSSEA